MIRTTLVLATLTLVSALAASPVAAQDSWSLSVSGIFGGSLPLEVNGVHITDPSVPLNLQVDGGLNKKAPVLGGRVSVFKLRARGPEVGFNADVRTFRYDGKAGVPTHVTGTAEGMRVDEVELSAGDQTRVTMYLASVLVRWPLARTADRPSGRWVPYAGIGGGNQHANIMSPEPSFTTNAPTFQALGGFEVMATRRVGFFTEYRYEHLKDEVTTDSTTVNLRLRTHHVAGGISIYF